MGNVAWFVLGGISIVLLLFGATLSVLRWRRTTNGWARKLLGAAAGLLLSLSSLVILCVGGELWFFCFPQSSNNATTIGHARWKAVYQGPQNVRDLRDKAHVYTGRPIVAVVGDSFAEGAGVTVNQRFSARLQELLPQKEVWTVAHTGWDTAREIDELKKTDLSHVETVVLQYFMNDIEGVAQKNGLWRPKVNLRPPAWVNASYLADQVWGRYQQFQTDTETYKAYLTDCYENREIWDAHRADLTKFHETCKRRNIRLVVLIFPFLSSPENSRPMVDKVAAHFRERSVPVVDVTTLTEGRATSYLIVSAMDQHPSPQLHREVAGVLSEAIPENTADRHPADGRLSRAPLRQIVEPR